MEKIGIVCAVETELEPFLEALEGGAVSRRAMLAFHEGTLCGVRVVALYSGVCKVNAAIAAQVLIDGYGVDAVVMSGTAGGIDPRLAIGDSVVATEVCYHDVAAGVLTDYHPWLPEECFRTSPALLALCRKAAGQAAGGGAVFYGRVATGEAFIDQEGRREIIERCAPLCVDMETAAVAHVCHANGLPFIAVRSISDTGAQSGQAVFDENCGLAARRSFALVAAMLGAMQKRGAHG